MTKSVNDILAPACAHGSDSERSGIPDRLAYEEIARRSQRATMPEEISACTQLRLPQRWQHIPNKGEHLTSIDTTTISSMNAQEWIVCTECVIIEK